MFRSFLVLACAGSLGACHVYSRPEPVYGVAQVTAAPVEVDLERYPHTIYAGRPVFFFRSRWYFRDDAGRWFYYPQEPPQLFEFRQRGYVQQAPPAPRNNVPAPAVPVQ